MMTQELQNQFLSLSSAERSSLIQFLTQSLDDPSLKESPSLQSSHRGISKTPGVMGGEACIRETRVPIWLLVSFRRLGLSEAKLLDNYPMLTAHDLVNAWSYADSYPDEIDRVIA